MTFVAACLQLCSSTDVDENIATVETLARRAKAEGAEYLQTPEMTNIVQRRRKELFKVIEPEAEDRAVKAFSALARELGVVLHLGSVALAAGDDGKVALWDLDGAKRIHRFEGHEAKIVGLAVSPDGRWAASLEVMPPSLIPPYQATESLKTAGGWRRNRSSFRRRSKSSCASIHR